MDLTPKQILRGTIAFECVSNTFYIAGIAVCYRWQPIRRMLQLPAMQRFVRGNRVARYAEGKIVKYTRWAAESKYMQWTAKRLRLDSHRFTAALVENMALFELMTLPVVLPAATGAAYMATLE